jgi:hypothetical protein
VKPEAAFLLLQLDQVIILKINAFLCYLARQEEEVQLFDVSPIPLTLPLVFSIGFVRHSNPHS